MQHLPFQRCILGLLALASVAAVACDSDEPPAIAHGPWIAYPDSLFGTSGSIHLVNTATGEERAIGSSAMYRSVTWSPDGARIAAVRDGSPPEIVVLPTGSNDRSPALPVSSGDTALFWSPNGIRIAAVSAEAITLLTPELDIVARFQLLEGVPASGEVGEGLWSPEGGYFAVPFNGYLVVLQPAARWLLVDPDQFVRDPGQSPVLTVVDWPEEGVVAIFEEPAMGGPTRYVLNVTEDPPVLTASSDFPLGTGPLDGIISDALAASGGREVFVGRRGQPGAARWVAAVPATPGGAPDLFVRIEGVFRVVLGGRFAGADAAAVAADVGLLLASPPGDS